MIFFENSPVPSYPEEGLHLSLLNPLPPQEGKDLKPGRLGLYEQTSSRPQGVARGLPTQQSCDCLCAEGAAAHSIIHLDKRLNVVFILKVNEI